MYYASSGIFAGMRIAAGRVVAAYRARINAAIGVTLQSWAPPTSSAI
jgi:hypothetical protein